MFKRKLGSIVIATGIFFLQTGCIDSASNRIAKNLSNNSGLDPQNTTYNFDPLLQLTGNSIQKNSHMIDMLPILPLSAGQYKPEMNQLKTQKICIGSDNGSGIGLKRVKFVHGTVRTDLGTDINIYYAENNEFYYVGDVVIDQDTRYMIVFAPGKPVPLFYVKYQGNYPQVLGGSGLVTNNSEESIHLPSTAQVLTYEQKIESDYHLSVLQKPRCGRKDGSDPTASFVDTEISLYSASYQGEVERKDNTTGSTCLSALQAIQSSFAHLQKKQERPLKIVPIENRLNAMQGNILRLTCNNGSYLVPTNITQEKIYYTGHSVYLAKLIMSVDKNANLEDLYFTPHISVPEIDKDYPVVSSVKIAPYISEVTTSIDSSLKEIIAYIPLNHLLDCKKLYEAAGYTYHSHPEKRPLSTQVMQEYESSTKTVHFEFTLASSEESTHAEEKCKGDAPKTSPLIIQFGHEKVISVLDKPVSYDYDADGKKDSIRGWPKYSEKNRIGLIVHKHQKGYQLLGNTTVLSGKSSFADGHEVLEVFDRDNNGIIDAADKVLDDVLFIWFDKNHNAQIEKQEIVSFHHMGVKSIDVSHVIYETKKVSHPQWAYIDTSNTVVSSRRSLKASIMDLWFTVK